ncbi:hypothetical protein BAUCODRAFT_29738 [Baudoinia panamericana UAMH 10762]|uniref:Heterokaryon incompatibility domain-containing protein n=1 Tax=Baudoinia panamericana (strain UAMH 10762) TaxID=717646 RepID=M2NP20_BAUPA|nr:uncharacterized protein BAUCODRAFT_29738 [Baudoinia panamericana UAMH 10762]EMD01295.1 hypothetical protein BAUCODRAFT_29738 [Baudoinia panamericana UAMH 10762]
MPRDARWHKFKWYDSSYDETNDEPVAIEPSPNVADGMCASCAALHLGQAYNAGGVRTGALYERQDPDHPAFVSMSALLSSGHGCACCDFLFHAIRRALYIRWPGTTTEFDSEEFKEFCEARLEGIESRGTSLTLFAINPKLQGTMRGRGTVELYIAPESSEEDRETRGSLRPCNKDLAADGAALLLAQWLEACNNTHCECQPAASTKHIPKRLLYVGTEQQPALRLCCTNEVAEPYVVLSYCWGLGNDIRTTSENVSIHTVRIEEDNLPKTYSDTIALTRRLGIRWLWIDALCILQDSYKDWDEQAAQMDAVYRNAYLCICASSASGVSEGYIRPRKDLSVRCGYTNVIGARRPLRIAETEDDIPTRNDYLDEPLLQRGWAVQERMLARRAVLFTTRQMLRECANVCVPSLATPLKQMTQSGNGTWPFDVAEKKCPRLAHWNHGMKQCRTTRDACSRGLPTASPLSLAWLSSMLVSSVIATLQVIG